MDFKIAVLAGDGIGPEISVQGVDVMSAVCEKFGHKVSYEYAICGADAIDGNFTISALRRLSICLTGGNG